MVIDDPGWVPLPFRRSCATILQSQNDYLRELCSAKVNALSCRCSACDTDDKYPVLASSVHAPVLNTGYDGSGGALSTGTDLQWETGVGTFAGGPASVANWIPAYVAQNTAWAPSPWGNASWVSCFQTTNHPGTPKADVDAYFRIRFNLASSVDLAAFAVTMDFYADNRVWEIYVNGVPQSTMPNGTSVLPQFFPNIPATQYEAPGYSPGSQVTITLDNSWQQCDNEIVVHVMSAPHALGFLAQNTFEVDPEESGCKCECHCREADFPELKPCISVAWGDSPCDCMESDDVEVLCVTVCNCYSNVSFTNFSIAQIVVTDMQGNPVPQLPDGTFSVQVIPSGPICFGDIGPCLDDDHPTCVSRELVLYTRGAVGQEYRLSMNGVCFEVCHQYQSEACFVLAVCQD
jgi:hypothetical protein